MDSLLQQEEQHKHKPPSKATPTFSLASQQQQQQPSSSFSTSFVPSVPTSPTSFSPSLPPKGAGGSLLVKPLVVPVAQTRTTTPSSPPLLLSPSLISRSPSTIKKGQLKIPLPIKTTTTPTTKKMIPLAVAGSPPSLTNMETQNNNGAQHPEQLEDEIQNGHTDNNGILPQSPSGSLSFSSSSPLSTPTEGGAFEKVTAGGGHGGMTLQLPSDNLTNPEPLLPPSSPQGQVDVSSSSNNHADRNDSDPGFPPEVVEETASVVELVGDDPEKPILETSVATSTSPVPIMDKEGDDDNQETEVLSSCLLDSDPSMDGTAIPIPVNDLQQPQQLHPSPVQNQGESQRLPATEDVSEAIEPKPVTTTTASSSSSNVPGSDGGKGDNGNSDNNSVEESMMMRMMGVMESVGVPASALSSTLHSAPHDDESSNVIEDVQPRATVIMDSLDHSTDAELLKENFSSQLARLVENHQMEQQQLQQHYEERLQELNLVLQQSKADYERQVEGWRLQRDSLKHELEGTQELLTAKKNDERKLQNAHLKELRSMEKQLNEKEKGQEVLQIELNEQGVRTFAYSIVKEGRLLLVLLYFKSLCDDGDY